MSNENLMWKDSGKAEQLWKGPIFSIDQVPRINPAGKEQAMIVCRVPNWVTVIPELPGEDENDFLMVRQYRHGSGRISCEFPAGVVDPGESDMEAAVRELREETGFTADEMIEIGRINPNSAFMSNRSTTFLARGLKKTHELDLDENEFLEWSRESYSHILENMGHGEYDNAIMVQCWYWYLRYSKLV